MEYLESINSNYLLLIALVLAVLVFVCSTWIYLALKPKDNPSGNECDTDFIQSELNVKKARLKGDLWK